MSSNILAFARCHWRAIILWVLGGLILALIIGASDSVKACPHEQPQGNPAKATQEGFSLFGFSIVSAHCIWFFFKDNSEPIIALATIALFIATYRLWKATGSLVGDAEMTAQHQLRAYVSVKALGLGPDRWDRFGIRLKNFGLTPAFVTDVTMTRKVLPYPLSDDYVFVDDPDPAPTGFHVVNPGERFPSTSSDFAPIFDSVRDGIINKALINGTRTALYCYGTVRFKDVFGAERWVNYCAIFGGPFPFDVKQWSLHRRHNDTSEAPQ